MKNNVNILFYHNFIQGVSGEYPLLDFVGNLPTFMVEKRHPKPLKTWL